MKLPNLTGKEFTCYLCNGLFIGGDNHEFSEQEANELWGEEDLSQGFEVICDDCFKKYFPSFVKEKSENETP